MSPTHQLPSNASEPAQGAAEAASPTTSATPHGSASELEVDEAAVSNAPHARPAGASWHVPGQVVLDAAPAQEEGAAVDAGPASRAALSILSAQAALDAAPSTVDGAQGVGLDAAAAHEGRAALDAAPAYNFDRAATTRHAYLGGKCCSCPGSITGWGLCCVWQCGTVHSPVGIASCSESPLTGDHTSQRGRGC